MIEKADVKAVEILVESKNSTRYFINVGRKDGFDWMKLKDFLRDHLELGKDDIFKAEVKDSFSFFNTENELKEKVLAFFTDFKHEGRFVNVEVSENRGGGGRRDRKGGGRRRDDKRGGGRREGRRSDSGNRRERRRSEGNSKPRRSDSGSKSNDFASSRPRRSRR